MKIDLVFWVSLLAFLPSYDLSELPPPGIHRLRHQRHHTAHHLSHQPPSPQDIHDNKLVKEPPTAPEGCQNNRCHNQVQGDEPLTQEGEEALRKMRLNKIKKQILWKLRLNEAPDMSHMPQEKLPLPLADGTFLSHPGAAQGNRDLEDFYGKTEQVIVYPESHAIQRCSSGKSEQSRYACFLFNLPKEVHRQEISSAELWFYKSTEENDGRNHTFSVSEISWSEGNDPGEIKSKPVGTRDSLLKNDEWINFNITKSMSLWLERGIYSHSLKIGCKSCSISSHEGGTNDTNKDFRPFIIIYISNSLKKQRKRRNVDCSSKRPECCRESFKVSFKELGWDNWIIQPSEYDAYYCKGSCINENGLAHSSGHRTTVMQKYSQKGRFDNNTEIIPCCTGTKMSSISLILRDPENLRNTFKKETLPNMVVESCGCF